MIVISLDPAFYAEKAREALGSAAPQIEDSASVQPSALKRVTNHLKTRKEIGNG